MREPTSPTPPPPSPAMAPSADYEAAKGEAEHDESADRFAAQGEAGLGSPEQLQTENASEAGRTIGVGGGAGGAFRGRQGGRRTLRSAGGGKAEGKDAGVYFEDLDIVRRKTPNDELRIATLLVPGGGGGGSGGGIVRSEERRVGKGGRRRRWA